jgi:hypothetical protein
VQRADRARTSRDRIWRKDARLWGDRPIRPSWPTAWAG